MSIHRSIIVRKLARACEIEQELGMKQNLIFQYNDKVRATRRRPGAHAAEIIVYWLLALLGAAVMVYGCYASEITIPQCLAQVWEVLKQNWVVLVFVLLHGMFALYWGLLCRITVAEVIPFYQLPSKWLPRWVFVTLGRYRDLHQEIKAADDHRGETPGLTP